jgi:hypothetical protein
MGTQVSPPKFRFKRLPKTSPAQTHVNVPSAGQDASIQTNPTNRPRLSLASQLQIDVPPSSPIARRRATSSAQTDPVTAVATTQPLGRNVRPSWTFKVPRFALGHRPAELAAQRQQQRRDQLAITYQPSPKKKTPVQKRVRKAPIKYTPEMIRKGVKRKRAAFTARRQLNLDEPIASGSTQQPAPTQSTSTSTHDNPRPSTSTFKIPRVTVRRRPVGLANQRQLQRSAQPSPKKKRERKAPERYNPQMITPEMMRRGVKRRKGEKKAAFEARQRVFDEAVASRDVQQPAANPSLPARAQPRWMPSKSTVKRTATAANLDTPLSKSKVGGKRGRPTQGEKRSVPATFPTLQLRKRGKKE